MIELQNVSIKFNKIIFKNFNLIIKDKSKVAIIGESGSGKSTLLNLLAGFIKPNEGNIIINGIPLKHDTLKKIRSEIAWLPQGIDIYFENVKSLIYSLFQIRINKNNRPNEKQIISMFNKLGLDKDILNKKLSEISGGQKQRVLLAAILLTKKKIYLLDEPTSALDKTNTLKVSKILKNIDATVICATHDPLLYSQMDTVINLDKIN